MTGGAFDTVGRSGDGDPPFAGPTLGAARPESPDAGGANAADPDAGGGPAVPCDAGLAIPPAGGAPAACGGR
jgi:hypothetical protein